MRILIVEDAVERVEQFIEWLDNHEVVFMASAEKARAWLKDNACDVVFLDHDLQPEHYYALVSGGPYGDGTGADVADAIPLGTLVVVHSMNPSALRRIAARLPKGSLVVHAPFPVLNAITVARILAHR